MSSWSLVNSPNLNHLRTQCDCELAHKVKTESSDTSFGLDAPSIEGTSWVSETPRDVCLLSGRTAGNQTAEILSGCHFFCGSYPQIL